MSDVSRLLVQILLDEELRGRWEADPEAVLAAWDLTDEERDVLRTGDARMMRLLGRALLDEMGGADEARRTMTTPAPLAPAEGARPALDVPPARVYLRLMPHVTTDEGEERVRWLTTLSAEPPPHDAPRPSVPGLPPTSRELPEMAFEVTVFVTPIGDGETRFVWQPSITATRPVEADVVDAFGHDTTSAGVLAAAEAVRAAPAEQRLDALLELVSRMRGGQ